MCCEACPKYKKCEENNRLKDNCSSKCPGYYDCKDMDTGKRDNDDEDYF
ncbi:MAG: hypothetical protein ISS47_09310 [Candidatus Omnitrophica bacterium]|nr:hypothetical protein [Candidatus Omnitrophota bacterium]